MPQQKNHLLDDPARFGLPRARLYSACHCHSRVGGNPGFSTRFAWIPAFAGMTKLNSTFPLPLGEGQGEGDFPLLTKEGLGEVAHAPHGFTGISTSYCSCEQIPIFLPIGVVSESKCVR